MRQKKICNCALPRKFLARVIRRGGVKQSGKLYVLPLLSLSLSRFFALSRVLCLPPSRFQRLFVLPLPLTGPIFISSQEVFKQSYVLSFDNCTREFAINRPWKKLRIYHGGRGALIKYFDLWNAFFYRYRSKGKERREEKEGEEGRERKRREKDEKRKRRGEFARKTEETRREGGKWLTFWLDPHREDGRGIRNNKRDH